MVDITTGELQITNLTRVEEVHLRKSHRICKARKWDSFACILAGRVDYHMESGNSFTLSAGDVQYLPRHCAYTMDIYPEGLHYIVCDFSSITEGERKELWFSARNRQIYEKLFRELNVCFSAEIPERMPLSLAVLLQIYAQIVRDYHPGYISGMAKKRLSGMQTYILRNLTDKELSVRQLAKNAKMSEVHFRRLFHDIYGTSPTKYITATRVTKAKSLMGLSEMRLEDIAAQTGFSSVAYFCTVFKETTGLTPSQYRRQMDLTIGEKEM